MNVCDLLLDDDLDMCVKGGDLAIGESTVQHQALLLFANQGEWR